MKAIKRFHLSPIRIWIAPIALLIVTGCGSSRAAHAPLSATTAPLDLTLPVAPDIRKDLYHEVAPMETVWRLSKMYNVPQAEIIKANQLPNDTLQVGQQLLIPNAKTAEPIIPLYNTRAWDYIVVHHTATKRGNALTIDESHRNYRRFRHGMGYHFLIDNGTLGKQMGQVEVGPRWIKQMNGAHANANRMNERGIGVSLVGNFSNTRVPKSQMDTLVFLVNELRHHYGIPMSNIIRHGDVPGKNTECPGNHFPWQEFKARLS